MGQPPLASGNPPPQPQPPTILSASYEMTKDEEEDKHLKGGEKRVL